MKTRLPRVIGTASSRWDKVSKCWSATLRSALIAGALAASPAFASLSLEKHAITGGGGNSSSQRFKLLGAIGQPATGVLTNERFTLASGLWNESLTHSFLNQPNLTTSQTSSNALLLTWSAAWKNWFLQQHLDDEWVDIFPPRQQSGGQIQALISPAPTNPTFRLSPVAAPPPPHLRIAKVSPHLLMLSWPVTEKPWQLQEKYPLPASNWREKVVTTQVTNGWVYAFLTPDRQQGYYRLVKSSALVPPRLKIFLTSANSAMVSWPLTIEAWQLQETTNANSGPWTNVSILPQQAGQNYEVVILPLGKERYFRLTKTSFINP